MGSRLEGKEVRAHAREEPGELTVPGGRGLRGGEEGVEVEEGGGPEEDDAGQLKGDRRQLGDSWI